jgi:uracil-DNA glycosylase family 4
MNENPNCELCDLHRSAGRRSRCLKGEGGDNPRLVIYMDAPTIVEDRRGRALVSDGADVLRWMLKRMSLRFEDVYIDYVLKCFPGGEKNYGKKAYRQGYIEACSVYRIATLQSLRPVAVVGMGSVTCEAFMSSGKVAEFEGTDWIPLEPLMREFVPRVFITYSPAYALQDPAETVPIYRTLFAAAKAAGLEPKFDQTIPAFDYGT